MSLNASWAPDESKNSIVHEHLILEGTFLGCVAYGVLLLLYWQCAHLMLTSRDKTKHTWLQLAYITALFICGTLGTASGIKTAELDWIDNRNYPGGPYIFGNIFSNLPVSNMGFIAFTVAVWLQDGYLLYRFLVIWDWNWYLFIFPSLLYLASIGLSIILMAMVVQPNASLWNSFSVSLFIPFWSISISLNVILTGLITARLLWLKSRIRKILGVAHSSMYTSISALLIESAALYTIFALMYVVMYALRNKAQNIVIPILTLMTSIAPMLITYRVANGRAWTSQTIHISTQMMFEATSPVSDGRSKVYVQTVTGGRQASIPPTSPSPSEIERKMDKMTNIPLDQPHHENLPRLRHLGDENV